MPVSHNPLADLFQNVLRSPVILSDLRGVKRGFQFLVSNRRWIAIIQARADVTRLANDFVEGAAVVVQNSPPSLLC